MTRINLFHAAPSTLNSVTWGKSSSSKTHFNPTTSTLIFAALLIVCSLAVGCSNDKPKPVSSTNQSPIVQTAPALPSSTPPATPMQQAAAKPVPKKVVRKVSPTVTYVNDASGVSFQYPRKYALKTGDAANELVSSSSVPMDFAQSGGVPLVAVALPDSTYPGSDLASAFFDVSVNKTLTADQCIEFSVPQPKPAAPAVPATQATAQPAAQPVSEMPVSKSPSSTPPASKLIIGDLELASAETNGAEETKIKPGTRDEAAKYYHVFQNGACYEFALKVTTTKADPAATTESTIKPINRDQVFHRLDQILATVEIKPNSTTTPDTNAEVKPNTTPAETPAQ
jgi:hypothetical protein